MDHMPFERPLTILVGLGFPARITSVMEAYALLQDWPHTARNGSYQVAANVCKAALAGDVDAETVRASLEGFARRNDILIPNDTRVPAPAGADVSGSVQG